MPTRSTTPRPRVAVSGTSPRQLLRAMLVAVPASLLAWAALLVPLAAILW
jgi:hypothetical protein